MALPHPTPPLLLTKRLTAFLHSSLTPSLHTALLTTTHGKLLAHASSLPVSALRTQCTVASSLWAIHTAAASSISDALPGSPSEEGSPPPTPTTVTVQLTGGGVVIRRLKCGLIFVCIGASEQGDRVQGAAETAGTNGGGSHSPTPRSPSEADSVLSTGGATTASHASTVSVGASAVVAMRRHAEELAKWLDDKLGSLRVPEDGVCVD